MARKFVIKCLLLIPVLVVLNEVYNLTLYESDLKKISPELIHLRESLGKTDVYYFGESSNVTYSPDDSVRLSISELTALQFPAMKFTNINKYATHAGMYRHWLNVIDDAVPLPEAIVVTLNLRSFGAAWIHSDLETKLQGALVLSRPFPNLINRFLLSLQAYDHKSGAERQRDLLAEWESKELNFPYPFKYRTVSEWDKGVAWGGYLKPDGSWDQPKIELACHYIKGYAFSIDEENERVKDFDAIFSWCKKKNIYLYLNLMAENTEYADSLVGKDLIYLMEKNRKFLVDRYNKNTCRVVDNLSLIRGEQFIDKHWTTEHYRYKGRQIIADNLASALSEQFKEEYRKPN